MPPGREDAVSHPLSIILHSLSLHELVLPSLRQMSFQVVDDTKMLGRYSCQSQAVLLSLCVAVSGHPLFLFQKDRGTRCRFMSMKYLPSRLFLPCEHKYTRGSLLGLSNRTKEKLALPCEPGQPAHSVLTVLERMKHS